jgi:ligand-binding SRPBCC domain-containing protein
MSKSCESRNLPEDFRINIDIFEDGYRLETFQSFSISRQKAFVFFENPKNLFDITPEWLDFRMVTKSDKVFEGVEYDYYIRWFGLQLKWRSRIKTYNPPYDFTDVQIIGPYTKWEHTHSFKEHGERTLMYDTVIYKIPFSNLGRVVHWLFVKNQLRDIFCYRAMKIMEWARKAKDED